MVVEPAMEAVARSSSQVTLLAADLSEESLRRLYERQM